MKIYDQNPLGSPATETHRSQEVAPSDRASGGRPAHRGGEVSDRVEFSGTLGRLSQALSNFENSRSGRVQALAAEYQSGKYHPQSAAISRGLIGEALGTGLE